MFEKVVTAFEPFGLTIVVLAGLALTNRIKFADNAIVGYVTIFTGLALVIVHITRQLVANTNNKRGH